MRACFLGQNVFALGYGVATLQAPSLVNDQPGRPAAAKGGKAAPETKKTRPYRGRPNQPKRDNKSAT
jgi:hypothetical protein